MNDIKPTASGPYPVIVSLECKACGRCIAACPKHVLHMGAALNARGYPFAEYDGEGCIGCGNCFYACPEPNAVQVHIPVTKPDKAEA
ncbi:MAG: ferredoxin family protein [Verrucomicrobiota bacterium]|jgi:NAD-dependent dihydropyrimidine dehydrogenase PreA subunit|nr:ferredoxin family protein [Verrucomicrobiota bacterium]